MAISTDKRDTLSQHQASWVSSYTRLAFELLDKQPFADKDLEGYSTDVLVMRSAGLIDGEPASWAFKPKIESKIRDQYQDPRDDGLCRECGNDGFQNDGGTYRCPTPDCEETFSREQIEAYYKA